MPTGRLAWVRGPQMVRRLFLFAVVVAIVAACGGLEAGAPPAPNPPRQRQAGGLSLERAVGRKILTGMDGTFPSRSLRRRVRRGQVGGVIKFGPNIAPGLGRAIAALQR